MKNRRFLLPLSFILFFQFSYAQLIMVDSETGEYSYEEVVQVAGNSQSQILDRANQWLEIYYENQMPIARDSSQVSVKGNKHIHWEFIGKKIDTHLFFDVEIKTKEGKYKYKFSNFEVGKLNLGTLDASSLKTYIDRFPKKYQILLEEPIDTEITNAIESLEYFVNNGKMQKEDDDW